MSPETQDVLNNLIKIGIPALLTGVAGFLVAWHNSRSVTAKLHFERRTKMLDEVRSMFESYANHIMMLHGEATGLIAAGNLTPRIPGAELFVGQEWPKLLIKKKNLLGEVNSVAPAQSMLLMLGEEESEKCLIAAMEAYQKLFLAIDFRDNKITCAVDEVANEARLARVAFFNSLAKAYNR